jgi:hypothetical protein
MNRRPPAIHSNCARAPHLRLRSVDGAMVDLKADLKASNEVLQMRAGDRSVTATSIRTAQAVVEGTVSGLNFRVTAAHFHTAGPQNGPWRFRAQGRQRLFDDHRAQAEDLDGGQVVRQYPPRLGAGEIRVS